MREPNNNTTATSRSQLTPPFQNPTSTSNINNSYSFSAPKIQPYLITSVYSSSLSEEERKVYADMHLHEEECIATLLKILGYKKTPEEILHSMNIVKLQLKNDRRLYKYGQSTVLTPKEVKARILHKFKSDRDIYSDAAFVYTDPTTKKIVVDEYPYVYEHNYKFFRTPHGLYRGPCFAAENGQEFLAPAKYFKSKETSQSYLYVQNLIQEKQNAQYQQIFKLYQELKTTQITSQEILNEQISRLKEFLDSTPEITYYRLLKDKVEITFGWRWIVDTDQVYTPRYAPPAVFGYNLKTQEFYATKEYTHPHALHNGQLCMGRMAQTFFKYVKEDFYLGIARALHEFAMQWSSSDAINGGRAPWKIMTRYIVKNYENLNNDQLKFLLEEIPTQIEWSCHLLGTSTALNSRIEQVLGGKPDLTAFCDYAPTGAHWLIGDTDPSPQCLQLLPPEEVEIEKCEADELSTPNSGDWDTDTSLSDNLTEEGSTTQEG